MTPRVSVLVVTWNVRDPALACLASLGAAFPATSWEAIVVDNGSSDGTAQALRDQGIATQVIDSPVNDGFGAGTNRAAGSARGELLLVLNPDTVMAPGAGDALVAFLDQHPAALAAGPQLLHEDGTVQSSRRRFPRPATLFLESTPIQQRFPGLPVFAAYYREDLPDDQAAPVDWVVGAAFLIRRSAFDAVNGFDPAFFLYFEETDLFRRLRHEVPGEVWYVPDARVTHLGGRSTDQDLGRRHLVFQSSRIRYARRHCGPGVATLLRAWLWGWSALQWLEEGAKYLLGHRRELRRRRMRDLSTALRAGMQA